MQSNRMIQPQSTLRILFIADVYGKPGRNAVKELLPKIKKAKKIDFTIANGENAAGGLGITPALAEDLLSYGIDVLTNGNHVWDKKEILPFLSSNHRLLRPANYPPDNPGVGAQAYKSMEGTPIGVINLQGRVYMPMTDCPFRMAVALIKELKDKANIIVVDFHAEATAEKVAMGWYLDGQVSVIVGTHTHVQTADEKVLPGGTGYITDLGMTGPTNSVIGLKKEIGIKKLLRQTPQKFEPANENIIFMAAIATINPETSKCISMERIQIPFP